MKFRPYALSIAGFDPSAGAGLLADIKTFEQHKVYGFGVCSALTCQNDSEFFSVEWVGIDKILDQIRPLTKRFTITSCKIGIISSLEMLEEVAHFLKKHNRDIRLVWDPVLRASAGPRFHGPLDAGVLQRVLEMTDLLTPNFPEMRQLENLLPQKLQFYSNVLLKGGHNPEKPGIDLLIDKERCTEIPAGASRIFQKHGSGCVLSAAITARLALGHSLPESCTLAKAYIESFLNSNNSLLGYHSSPTEKKVKL